MKSGVLLYISLFVPFLSNRVAWSRSVLITPLLFFLFLWDFGLSQLTSLQFIQRYVAGFYKLTIPQSPPSHLQDYSICKNARLEFSTIFVPGFDPNEWCLKNSLHSGGLNPGPLGLESSALTTRPRLLASKMFCFQSLVLNHGEGYEKVKVSKMFCFECLVLNHADGYEKVKVSKTFCFESFVLNHERQDGVWCFW